MMAQHDFDPDFANPAAWAAMYREAKCQVTPAKDPREVAPGESWKRPMGEWKGLESGLLDDATFAGMYGPAGRFRTRGNMGLITGAASGGIFVIDTDQGAGKDGEEIWRAFVVTHLNGIEPDCPMQLTGGGGRQRFFRAPEGWTPPTFKTRIGVDIRGEGGFAMLPPSMHESGREYAWVTGRELWADEVPDAPGEVVAFVDRLREEYARNAGQGTNGAHSPEVGQSANAFGLTDDGREERMRNIIWGVVCDLKRALPDVTDPSTHPLAISECERAWGLYLFEVKSRISGVSQEEGLEREGRGRSAFNERWLRALAQWNGKVAQEAARPKPNPRPKDEPLEGFDPFTRREYPGFPLHCLPRAVKAFIEHQVFTAGVSEAGMAMAVLTAVGGALDQRFRLRMMRSAAWYVPPRLWTLLVGGPSSRKTPISRAALNPLLALERDWEARRAADWARYEALKEAGEPTPTKPPPATRLIIQSTTIEAAGAILAQQDRGALLWQEELGGFLGSFDRYSNSQGGGGDRGFWLNAYDGGSYHVDRREAGKSLVISNLCVGFLGGVQPARLQEFEKLTSDGLLQRFNPIMIRRGPFEGEAGSGEISTAYDNIITYVAQMKPQTFQLTDDAHKAALAFRREIYEMEGEFEDDDSGFVSWLGKLAATHGSLSLILHILEDKENAPFMEVGRETVDAATEICRDFLLPHAMTFYQEVMGREVRVNQRRLAGYLLTAPKDRFTYADLRANGGFDKVKSLLEMTVALAPFVNAGWLIEDKNSWELAPWVRDRFAAEREAELARRATVAKRFKRKTA